MAIKDSWIEQQGDDTRQYFVKQDETVGYLDYPKILEISQPTGRYKAGDILTWDNTQMLYIHPLGYNIHGQTAALMFEAGRAKAGQQA